MGLVGKVDDGGRGIVNSLACFSTIIVRLVRLVRRCHYPSTITFILADFIHTQVSWWRVTYVNVGVRTLGFG